MTTATSWISKDPEVCGGAARIRDTRHTVHGLIEWQRSGVTDAQLLTMFDPPLSQADLEAAWDYAAANSREIEQELWLDRAAMIDREAGEPVAESFLAEGVRLGLSEDAIRDAFEPPLSRSEWRAPVPANGAA